MFMVLTDRANSYSGGNSARSPNSNPVSYLAEGMN
jgi:hypothetical protein